MGHYMTRDERQQLEALYTAGIPVAQIARQLGFCRQTIYNEIKRGLYTHTCDWWDELRYSAQKAQQKHEYNQTAKGRPLKIGNHHKYAEYLEHKILKDRYSPAAALAAARSEGFTITICTATLYSYIEKRVFLHLTNRHLWEKGKRKKRAYQPVKRIAHPALPSITERPEQINQRKRRGDWEMDLVIGKAGTKHCLLTLTERKTREELIFKLQDKRAAGVRSVFDQLERSMGKEKFREKFRSITTDNGPEFLEYDLLRESIYGGNRFQVWYCHSYAAWEKGSNENHNRMIRRWFPKGTDFTKIRQHEILNLQNWMNQYPRKILNWKTPAQLTA